MFSKLRPRLTYANVVSTVCLFIVLGGTSYAALKLPANSVGTEQLKKNAVTLKKIKRSARDALRGQKGETGPRGATGATGSPGPATGPAGGALTGNYPNPGLAAPEPWHAVTAGSFTSNACANPATTAVFCSVDASFGDFGPWQNYGGSLTTAAFYKDQLGIVHLKGVLAMPSIFGGDMHHTPDPARFPLFRLPVGYRPQATRIFASVGAARNAATAETRQEAAGRVDVEAGGLVVLEIDCLAQGSICSANGPYLTLDGVSFRPDE